MNIEGETAASFTAVNSGNYALILCFGACSDTSACENINILSLKEREENNPLEIYPNPGKEMLTINTAEFKELPTTISFYNSVRAMVDQKPLRGSSTCLISTEKLPAAYLIEIINGNVPYRSKWVKL